MYPKFLDGLKKKLEYECKQIRKLKKFHCQVRYSDDKFVLTTYVRAVYDDAPRGATFWQQRDDMIKNFGTFGFPPESLDGGGPERKTPIEL